MRNFLFVFLLIPLLGCGHSEPVSPTGQQADISSSEVKGRTQTQAKEEQPRVQKLTAQNTDVKDTKRSVMLDVPLINQNPELKYGCEVTSLTMVLQYAGIKIGKMDLYNRVKKDNDPLIRYKNDIVKWGNPAEGFVGDMTGKRAGYAVFDKPIEELVNKYLPGRAVNLTGQDFNSVLNHASKGFPVVVWTTGDYRLPDRWESWTHGSQTIKTPLDLHAVVLVGYDDNYVYLNDPLSGRKQVKVSKERFISSWKALRSRAVSYQ
ncbi:C39 family peptidase [Bacillus sp. ISL-47]|uniref:C39 family peptidase n=1 Tax=Bacillus sp. ISL-47 TaxID=2819130 RepID=UPI001BE58C6D|nr:C39 family peptidase [Bacillus sp. ISL-47]MBT2687827.1 C39 family peptidase [Bacillus sp. ISL-47]MBT2708096.1 C39 family peptidase [Pseudomonas sp. ISL-84]